MPAWTAPYVLAILIALIVIIVVFAVRSRRPNGGYYTGGYVSGDRVSHIPMLMRPSSGDSAFMHVLRKHLRRSSFHPTTRRVLETLDRLQRPEVDEVFRPSPIMPELRNKMREHSDEPVVFVRGDPRNINEFLAPKSSYHVTCMNPLCGQAIYLPLGPSVAYDDILCSSCNTIYTGFHVTEMLEAGYWEGVPQDQLAEFAEQTARIDEHFGAKGEPLATPPAPNIGTEAVPYAGPNYVEPSDLAEEMKGIVHYGRDDEQ